MLLSLVGTPSPLTYWTLHVLRTVVQVLRAEHSVMHVFRPDDVWACWADITGKTTAPVILFSDCAEGGLCDLLLSLDAPIIVTADDPSDTVSYLVASRNMRTEHALRLFSQCVSSLEILLSASQVFSVGKELYDRAVNDHVREMVRVCGLIAGEEEIAQIMLQLTINPPLRSDALAGREILGFVPDSRLPGSYDVLGEASPLTAVVAEQYGAILRNEPLQKVVWPRQIFPNFDDPDQFLAGPQQMVGRARYLVLGPYFHLPRGEWKVRVEIEVTHNESGNHIRSELVSGDAVVAAIHAPLPKEGVFAFDMTLTVLEPFLPIDVRIYMLYGAIEGTFLLRGVRFDRAPARPSGTEAALPTPKLRLQSLSAP